MMGGESLDISVRNAISPAAPKPAGNLVRRSSSKLRRIMRAPPRSCQTGFVTSRNKASAAPRGARASRLGGAKSPRIAWPSMPVGRFTLRTFGCQMNVHDSEKIANLLVHAGWAPEPDVERSDLVIVNTCSIREKAEHRLYSDLGGLRAWRGRRAGRLVGVGGCVAQQVGDALLARFPQV